MRKTTLTLAITTSFLCFTATVDAQNVALDNWSLLELADVREVVEGDEWRAEKSFPDALRNAAQNFEIAGFYVPIEAQAYVQSFILVSDPLNCPFCGDSGYGPVLEVKTARPMPDIAEFAPISLVGTLEFIDDTDTFQMFRLVDARLTN
ncbi:MAG: hypothetical protein AAGD04_11905 [Pseudomonadota bacterium]